MRELIAYVTIAVLVLSAAGAVWWVRLVLRRRRHQHIKVNLLDPADPPRNHRPETGGA